MSGNGPSVGRRTLVLLRPAAGRASLAAVLIVVTTAAALAGPLVLRFAIDHGLSAGHVHTGVVIRAALVYLAVALGAWLSTRTLTRLVAQVGEGFVRDLRRRVFAHVMDLPSQFFDRTPSGELLSRMTSDLDALQLLIEMGFVQLVQAMLTLAMIVTLLLVLSWQLALACLIVVPPVVAATLVFRRHSRRAYLNLRDRIADTVATLVESVSGMREVQAAGQEERMLARFEDRNQRQYRANVRSVTVQAFYLPFMEYLSTGTSCIALGLGGWMIARHQLSLGTLSAFVLYLQLTFDPVQSLSFLLNQLQSAQAALRKIYRLLDEQVELRPGMRQLPAGGAVELDGLCFGYPGGPPLLAGIDLRVEPGEKIALVGPTGAGKSTLAKLAARLYDPTSGAVRYGGVDLRAATFESLRRRIVMISQEGHLFAGTVRENIRMARPASTDAEVEAAVARIGAGPVFEAMPQGLDTDAGQAGALLSAGQRQLVALARAALLDSDVLILDEATSDLDPGTELVATSAMAELMAGRTVLVIAHRLSTILTCDRIAVVGEGGIAELGSHDELVALGGRYAALYDGWLRNVGAA